MPPTQFRLLVRGFIARLADNDVTAPGSDLTRSIIWLLAFLMTPGLMLSIMATPNYAVLRVLSRRIPDLLETATWRPMMVLVGLTISASGLIAAAAWDGLSIQRRDCLILFSLPVPLRRVMAAKLASIALFSLVVAVGMNGPTTLLFGLSMPLPTAGFIDVIRTTVAFFVSTTTASLTVFWGAVAVQGVVQMALPERASARASEAAQWLLAFASLFLFLILLLLVSRVRIPLLRFDGVHWPAMFAVPPVWFLGMYIWLSGTTRPAMPLLAAIGGLACAGSIAISLVTFLVSFERRVRRLIEQPDAAPSGTRAGAARVAGWIAARVSRTPAEAAVHLFTIRSFARNRVHRLGLSAALGLGFALVTYGMFGRGGLTAPAASEVTPSLLSIPLVLIFCGVSGMRILFALPTEPAARWCFELSGDFDPGAPRRAARMVILMWIVLPIALLTFASAAFFWDAPTAALHAAYSALLGAALTEIAIARLRKIPFTCRWVPGTMNFKMTWPIYIYAFSFFAYRMARLEAWLLESPARCAAFFALGLLILAAAAVRSSLRTQSVVFDETPDAFIQQLGLQRP